MGRDEQNTQNERSRPRKGWILAGSLLAVLITGAILVLTQFNIETIQVTGNVHYTDEEIIQMVVGDQHGKNSLLLFL